ncbi:hypothetical protein DFA_04658 [Cavenderia fasciculata]|uniref:Uncharacterized protein n=1 Tax=Cavenderia fasciculata TaxID=261658 RepID=F4PQ67_CACFS|nr:uncharacterized protein DFA_04658 [Cavenderia fasciculata]EGG22530.1 hypothetical protein DFA_04658 [Cavenderia fasciculata]|eukprot:XP_004360381.1 hypothetical protein DFA_04658 [Cavenderia fasciculata]
MNVGIADDSASFATLFKQQRFINSCIDLFCKATSSKVNEDKSSVILIEPDDNGSKVTIPDQQNRDTSYPIAGIERYLGLNFSKDGLSSKLEDIVNGAKAKLIKWKKDSITLKAKVNILKSYFGLVPHLPERIDKVINDLIRWKPKHNNNYRVTRQSPDWKRLLIGSCSATTVSTTHQSQPKEPCPRNAPYDRSTKVVNLWDLNARFHAQKAWMFERFLHDNRVAKVSFAQSWMDQLNQDKPNHFVRLCRSEWEKLTQPYDVSREAVPKPAMKPNKEEEYLSSKCTSKG